MEKVRLVFSTTAGDLEDDFPVNQPLNALKREVMGRLQLDPSQANEFIVTFEGNLLDESKTLAELGLQDNTVLLIERREAVKI